MENNERETIRESLKRFLASLNDEQIEVLRHVFIDELVERKLRKRLEEREKQLDENIDQSLRIANRRGA